MVSLEHKLFENTAARFIYYCEISNLGLCNFCDGLFPWTDKKCVFRKKLYLMFFRKLRKKSAILQGIIFLLIIACFALLAAPLKARNRIKAEFYLNRGLIFLQEDSLHQAISEFKKATSEDDHFAEAFHQLGLAYWKVNTLRSRMLADDALRRAVLLKPKSVRYRRDWAILLYKRTFVGTAEHQFKKILRQDSSDGRTHFYLGRINEESYFHFKRMVTELDTNTFLLSFRKFANEHRLKAVYHYRKAIKFCPDSTDAYHHLARILVEENQWSDVIRLCSTAAKRFPRWPDAHLLLGLAFHRLNEEKPAFENFRDGKKLLSVSDQKIFDSLALVSTPKMAARFASADSTRKKRLELRFWRRKDPLFLTSYNERLLEHYARLVYADLRFGRPEKGIRGWNTDRGKVFVRFGEPLSRFHTRPWIETSIGAGDPLHPSQADWRYPDFHLVFEDRYLNRRYDFAWGHTPGSDYRSRFRQIISEKPDRYVPRFRGECLKPVARWWAYKSWTSDSTRLQFVAGIPAFQAPNVLSGKQDAAFSHLKMGIFILDSTAQFVQKLQRVVFLKANYGETFGAPVYFLAQDSLKIIPGNYRMSVEFLDEKTGSAGVIRTPIVVPKFPADSLALSDLLLARKIILSESPANAAWPSMEVIPNFTVSYRRGEAIPLYYEIYNLRKDAFCRTHFRILTKIQRKQSSLGKLMGQVLFLLRRKGGQGSISIGYTYEGKSSIERQFRILSLPQMTPGSYELRITVQDQVSGQKISRVEQFQVTD